MTLYPSDPALTSPHQGLGKGVGEGSLPVLGCPDFDFWVSQMCDLGTVLLLPARQDFNSYLLEGKISSKRDSAAKQARICWL